MASTAGGAVFDRLALAAGGALERNARVDRQLAAFDGRTAALAVAAAPVVVATGGDAHGQRRYEAATHCRPT